MPFSQEGHFVNLTSRMHSLRPHSQTKILYYWNVGKAFNCYQSFQRLAVPSNASPNPNHHTLGLRLLERPDLWLRDSSGSPVNPITWDFRMEEARQMWIDGHHRSLKL